MFTNADLKYIVIEIMFRKERKIMPEAKVMKHFPILPEPFTITLLCNKVQKKYTYVNILENSFHI